MSKIVNYKKSIHSADLAGAKSAIKMVKGQHINVVLTQVSVRKQPAQEGVVVLKQGEDLVFRFGDGAEIRIDDYYTDCAENSCSVTLTDTGSVSHTFGVESALINTST